MRRHAMGCLAAVLAVGLAWPAGAQDDGNGASGTVMIGGQVTSVNGDEARFRENSLGQRDGLILDLLHYEQRQGTSNLTFDARFDAGGNGWLELDVVGEHWRGGFRLVRVNRWSDTSFADGFLPSGTAVSTLVPGTTTLDPLFGRNFPSEDLIRGEAYLTRRFTGADRLTLRVGGSSLDGKRVPSIGGFSFSDVGTASFYTAGLRADDSHSLWASLNGRFHLGPVLARASAGTMRREDDRSYRMPAYGQDGLIDLNRWRDRQEADTSWVRLEASWKGHAWTARGGAAYVNTSSHPAGGDAEVEADGTVRRPGLEIVGGPVTARSFSGALGVSWRIAQPLTLSLSADALHRYGSGDVGLLLRDQPYVPAVSNRDDTRVGGTLLAVLKLDGAALRLRVRGESTDAGIKESREPYSADLTRSTDRIDARLDGTVEIGGGWDLRAWARYRDDDIEVDLVDLWDGYTPGNWEREQTSGFAALSYHGGRIRVSLDATSSYSSVDSDVPYFDPIFDPSLELFPVSSSERFNRISGHLLWTFERGSVWLEGGWLQGKFDFPVRRLAGAAPVREKISGTVAALGGDLQAWHGGTVAGELQWVDNGDILDKSLFRSRLSVEQRIAGSSSLFIRWAYWDYSNTLAPVDEYTAHVFAAGVRTTF